MADDFSDLDDGELDSLYEKNINKRVQHTITRRSIPQQRNLVGQVLENQQPFYEEVQTTITYGPTHHDLNYDNLNTYIYPTNYEVRDYQFDIVRKALFQNLLCAIPTGMGKTFIASTVMLNFYRWTNTAKIIFTAPTRPLVAQQIKACLGITGIPNEETAILLDKTRKNREEIWATKRVFFTTPQVVENDLKRGVLNPKDVVCLVIDEAHRARGSYAYVNVVKFLDRFNSSYRTLALTATPAADLEGVQEVVGNLNVSIVEIRTEDSMDLVKYMKRRDKEKISVSLIPEIEDIIEQLGIAVTPVLNEAVELGIYDECEPSKINAFIAMQKSQKIIANPTIPEGVKWKNYFILQLLSHVGLMLRRLKIYGVRTFYSYFNNKYKEFTTKYALGKSTNKTAASFYYNPILKSMMRKCESLLSDSSFLGHEKLQHIRDEVSCFFKYSRSDSRVIIFTELRESALEIVKCIDSMNDSTLRPHIFIGQARGKEGFDDEEFARKHKPKGRKKAERLKRHEEERLKVEEKKRKKQEERLQRHSSRTGSSEEAQVTGMNQKQQKEVISKFKYGEYNVLVCTSIGEEGLDIGEVDLIICYDTTGSPIKNVQRMGRTGRKRDGKIVLLFSGNESYKFEQAMEDYAHIQRLVSQDSLDYKRSDRIVPEGIIPECQKKFITVSEENEEVNNMEDTDDVIKFATQAMLGKLKKPKRNKKSKQGKPVKKFFIPDNVETGIVPAISMVKKYKVGENGEKIVLTRNDAEKNNAQTAILDDIANDSLESSPAKSEAELAFFPEIKPLSHILNKGKNNLDPDSGTNDIQTPIHSTKRTFDTSNKFETSHVPLASSKKNITDRSHLTKKPRCGILEAPVPVLLHERVTSVPNGTGQCNGQKTGSSWNGEALYKNVFLRTDGLLTKAERTYFESQYSALCRVSIEAAPKFTSHTKQSKIAHCNKTQKIIDMFQSMDENRKESIIEMNRTKCLVLNIKNNRDIGSRLEDFLSPVLVSNDDIRYTRNNETSIHNGSANIESVEESDKNYDDGDLSKLLDSDFSDS